MVPNVIPTERTAETEVSRDSSESLKYSSEPTDTVQNMGLQMFDGNAPPPLLRAGSLAALGKKKTGSDISNCLKYCEYL